MTYPCRFPTHHMWRNTSSNADHRIHKQWQNRTTYFQHWLLTSTFHKANSLIFKYIVPLCFYQGNLKLHVTKIMFPKVMLQLAREGTMGWITVLSIISKDKVLFLEVWSIFFYFYTRIRIEYYSMHLSNRHAE